MERELGRGKGSLGRDLHSLKAISVLHTLNPDCDYRQGEGVIERGGEGDTGS